jgi:predicted permease
VADDPGQTDGTFRYAVSPGYFETMGIPLVRGRFLDQGDRAGGAPVAVISEAVARRRLPGRDPLGLQIQIGENWTYTVVGVVGNVRQISLALTNADAVYTTAPQWRFTENLMSMVVRTQGDPAAIAGQVRRAIWSVDKDQAVVRVVTMDGLIARSAAERRFTLILFQVFAAVALVLAAAGIYGVLSGSVAERTREIGVRSALGASRGSILSLVLGQGMSLTGAGMLIGLAGAIMTGRLIAGMLFGISPLDPFSYVSMLGLLGAVAVLACTVPAWRAMRVDPVTSLRTE